MAALTHLSSISGFRSGFSCFPTNKANLAVTITEFNKTLHLFGSLHHS
jgi:hypothetical protein